MKYFIKGSCSPLFTSFIFLFILFFRIYCPFTYANSITFKIILFIILIQFPYYILFSIARLAQIKQNYTNSFKIDDKFLNIIRKIFPSKTIYLYSKNRYISLSKNKPVPYGEFLLIRIGREELNKDKIFKEIEESKYDFKR